MFKKLDYPAAPMILALVLGNLTETALRQSLILSHGSFMIFFSQPIAGTFMIMAMLLAIFPFVRPAVGRLWR